MIVCIVLKSEGVSEARGGVARRSQRPTGNCHTNILLGCAVRGAYNFVRNDRLREIHNIWALCPTEG